MNGDIKTIVYGIISGLLVIIGSWLHKKYFSNKFILRFSSLRKYKNAIMEQVKEMPFIYKDIEFEVLDGYVELEIGKLDLKTLEIKNSNIVTSFNENEIFLSNPKILFLGSAGFGKTTLQRYAILSILNNEARGKFINNKEIVIPVFVPLKLLTNIEPSPIISHILKNNIYINSISKLESLLVSGRIILFLDGYDEIRLGENINFIQNELEAIMFPMESQWLRNTKPRYNKIYPLFNMCRVWLSSRKNFFKEYPLGILGNDRNLSHPVNFTAVELRGIGSNRNLLISKIFKRYKMHSNKLDKLLNTETFFNSIINCGDSELEKLSHSPLFLTVMCFIYINKVKEYERHDVEWMDDTEGLIIECIKLLLYDLDTEKVRMLPDAYRDGLKSRRNEFFDEKLAFLSFFSAKTYSSKITVFSYSYLQKMIKEFLEMSEEISTENKGIIIKGLEYEKKLNPNFAMQLVFCGLFITVQKDKNETYYDFPHRRFREVLASKEYSDPKKYSTLLIKLNEGNYSELLRFFMKTRSFLNENFHILTLQEILKKSTIVEKQNESVIASENFCIYKPIKIDINLEIEEFIKNQISKKAPSFKLSKLVLKNKFNQKFIEYLCTQLQNKLEEKNMKTYTMISDTMFHISKSRLITEIIRQKKPYKNPVSIINIKALLLSESLQNTSRLKDILNSKDSRFDLWYIIAKIEFSKDNFKILESLNINNYSYRIELNYFIHKYNPEKFNVFIQNSDLSINKDVYDILDKSKGEQKNYLNFLKKNIKGYFFSEDSIYNLKKFIESEIFSFNMLNSNNSYERFNENEETLLCNEIKDWIDTFPKQKFVFGLEEIFLGNNILDKYYIEDKNNLLLQSKKYEGKKDKLYITISMRNRVEYVDKNFAEIFVEYLNKNNTITEELYTETFEIIKKIKYEEPNIFNFYI